MTALAPPAPGQPGNRHVRSAAQLRHDFDQSFAQALPPPPDAAATEDYLAIRVGADPHALRLAEIASLAPLAALTRVPGPCPELLGVTALRGRLLPVYDLRTLLGAVAPPEERPQADALRRPPPEGDEETWGGPAFPHERPQADALRRPPCRPSPEGDEETRGGPARPPQGARWQVVLAAWPVALAFDRFEGHLRLPRPAAAAGSGPVQRQVLDVLHAGGAGVRPIVPLDAVLAAIRAAAGRARAAREPDDTG